MRRRGQQNEIEIQDTELRNTVANDLLNQTRLQRIEAIEDWLVNRLATILRIEPDGIDVEEPFANYGLGSYQGVELAGDLGNWLGRGLPETLVWDYPTIKEMARYLSNEQPCSRTTKFE